VISNSRKKDLDDVKVDISSFGEEDGHVRNKWRRKILGATG